MYSQSSYKFVCNVYSRLLLYISARSFTRLSHRKSWLRSSNFCTNSCASAPICALLHQFAHFCTYRYTVAPICALRQRFVRFLYSSVRFCTYLLVYMLRRSRFFAPNCAFWHRFAPFCDNLCLSVPRYRSVPFWISMFLLAPKYRKLILKKLLFPRFSRR